MSQVNHYRLAPTFLYNQDGESKLFTTQEAVDRAWDEGWFGPPWLISKVELLSSRKFSTKADLLEAVERDPRYKLSLSPKKTAAELMDAVRAYESREELDEYIKED